MKRRKADPLEGEMELAFDPGEFIGDHDCFEFVSGLEAVAAKVKALIAADPPRAASLYEVFLAGCHAKVEELDDSSGSFGQFVQDLMCGWIKARQAAGADAEETAARLLSWMDDDPYAFCYEIEKVAVKAFNKAGLAALAACSRTRFESAKDYHRRRFGDILRAVYTQQGNVEAYVALAEETGLTPRDCHALATILAARRKTDEALKWIERGMAMEPEPSYDLSRLHRELLIKLGRANEALEAAWAEYTRHPDRYSYEDFMEFVPKGERSVWRRKAIEAAGHGDLQSRIELYVDLKEIDLLADLVRGTVEEALEGVSHYATEPAARQLEKSHVDAAARLWRAQGMRIVNAKKSKYYQAAVSNFERAKRCYEKAGLEAEWASTVKRVRAAHFRKAGFMAGFEAVAAGSAKRREPSFLEQAKAKWRGAR